MIRIDTEIHNHPIHGFLLISVSRYYHSFSLARPPQPHGQFTHQVPLPAAAHSEQLDRGVTLNAPSAGNPPIRPRIPGEWFGMA